MVPLTRPTIAAISYTVEPVNKTCRLVLQSELVANEKPHAAGKDQRGAPVLESPLASEDHLVYDGERAGAILVHETRASRLRVAAGMVHEIHGPESGVTHITESPHPDLGRTTVVAEVSPGEKLNIVKYLSYDWSSEAHKSALIDHVTGALAAARLTGWEGLLAEQRGYLEEFWEGADVEVDGDREIQQAVRFGLFHVLQAGARAGRRPIAAKGLTGTGYDGHTFWDTETFVPPVLTYTRPRAARDALAWRHATLPEARRHAADLALAGAAFAWRTVQGRECSGYWPAGTAAFHVNADIADAVLRYLDATEDTEFERQAALELLVESARLWYSLGQHDAAGRFGSRA
jgi:alpha,alpha-trehalose phosphorylase